MFALGPFDLVAPLGQGGMGVVWRGVHRAWNVPVAVKLLTAKRAQDPEYLAAFRNEARAVAGLDHPHVVLVYDTGAVSRRESELSLGHLRAGTPWLAMELCEGGTLSRRGPMGWAEVREILLCLLDALAHAHARGVVHRDLKPGNVLVGGERPGIKLTDFGMATAVDHDPAVAPLLGGTPSYMAPEQAEGRWRDFGPWTDLYALGCLAWWRVTGKPPFPGGRTHVELPPLHPTLAVPPGFEAWARALLAVDPARRARCAADAAWGLLALPDLPPGSAAPTAPSEDETVPLHGQRVTLIWPSATTGPQPSRRREEPPPAAAPALPSPPLPRDWRRPATPAAWPHLRGVGLGSWALRTVPMVDRERERDALWSALRAARDEREPRAVVLHGPSGFGKSRLASWLTERAQEVGAATVLRITHDAGPMDGLGGMLTRHFRLAGLEGRDAVLARVTEVLGSAPDDDDALAVTELVAPVDEASDVRAVRFRSLQERFGVVRRLILRLAAARPVVLWAEDVSAGLQTLLLAQNLLSLDAPLLIVLTAADEALAERPIEAGALATLARRDGVSRVAVGPLPAEHRRELVRELLGLQGDLAARVEARTEGNPLFAVHLVGDWVARGLLVPGDAGFGLRAGVDVEIPADLRVVWTERLARALEGRGPEGAHALEIAACLGLDVDGDEWRAACAQAGIGAPIEVVEALISHRLAVAGAEGPATSWSFAHGMIRETLTQGAREAGRWAAHQRACAAMLRSRTHSGAADRLGRTLLAAGDAEAAVMPLLVAARRRQQIGDYGIAADLLAERERALDAALGDEDDPQRVEGWIASCLVQQLTGDLAAAEGLAAGAAAMAARLGEDALEASAARQLGRIQRRRGDLTAAWAHLERAERLATTANDLETLAGVHSEMGWIQLRRGKIDAARGFAELSEHGYARSNPRGRAAAWAQLGETARQAGDLAAAEAYFERSRDRYERDGFRWGVANSLNGLGELARTAGDLAKAEAHYRASYERYAALGETDAVFPETNLGLVLVEQRRWAEARRVLERVRARPGVASMYRLVAAVEAALLACSAGEGDGFAFDRALPRLLAAVGPQKLVDADLARLAGLAAELWGAAGDAERAARAAAVAQAQWRALGREDPR